jgi:hypothetical protein
MMATVSLAYLSLVVNAASASSSTNNDDNRHKNKRHRSIPQSKLLELQVLSRTLQSLQSENVLSDHTLHVLHSLENIQQRRR